jgi:hypothetical protein
MSEKNVWVLFDSVTQIQSQSLSQDQLQSAIYKMQKTDFARFHIWTTGWENWQALNIFLDSDQTVFIKDIETAKKLAEEKTVSRKLAKPNKVEEKPEITATQSVTMIKLDGEFTKTSQKESQSKFDVDNLTWSKAATPPTDLNFSKIKVTDYSNRAARHELKIEILLISAKGKTFRSHSKNISLTGSMLEDKVPFDYYGNIFDVIVVSRYADNPVNSRVQLKAKTVGEGLSARLQFENVTEDQKKRLTAMLNEYIEKQKAQATSKKAA